MYPWCAICYYIIPTKWCYNNLTIQLNEIILQSLEWAYYDRFESSCNLDFSIGVDNKISKGNTCIHDIANMWSNFIFVQQKSITGLGQLPQPTVSDRWPNNVNLAIYSNIQIYFFVIVVIHKCSFGYSFSC